MCRNILFSLVLITTTSTCTFLFYLFFALVANVQSVAETVETTVGIAVFFDEDVPEEQVLAAGDDIRGREEVREARYISAAQTWGNFRTEYFEGMEELAEGFADDDPLPGSASCEIFLNDIEEQDETVEHLEGMEGVRKVCYSSTVVVGLTSAGKMVRAMSAVIICVLLAVVVSLINNTIFVVATFRRREDEIMRLIGATNYMICAPFVAESVPLGTSEAAVSLAGMYVLYQRAVIYVGGYYQMPTGISEPIPLGDIFPYMAIAAGCLSAGIGFFASYFAIHRYLEVQGKRM